MNRYSSYGQADDPPLIEGDRSLLGTNDWDAAENLQPGQCQSAINMDFTTQDAVTRGGFVCLPALGAAPFPPSMTWTSRTSSSGLTWKGVAYGNGVYVAIAESAGVAACVMTSPDGITWTTRTAIEGTWYGIDYGAALFVVVGVSASAGHVMTSPDGITWTGRTAAELNTWRSVKFSDSKFIAVASSGTNRIMSSTNGTTWTLATSTGGSESLYGVTYGGSLWVAAANGSHILYSSDGNTWTTVVMTDPAINGATWTSIAYGKGLFTVVASNGLSGYSADAITWTSSTPAEANTWNSIVYGNNIFVAVASTGTNRVMISGNGITWTAVAAAAANAWESVGFGNSVYVAVSSTGVGNRVMTSGEQVAVWGSAPFSDPLDIGSDWIMMVGGTSVGFFSNGKSSRTISLGAYTVSAACTIVQCNNLVYLFRGPDAVPLYWSGNWADEFIIVPTTTPAAGFSIIPNSSQATYYQDRLWVVNGKDEIAASDVLDFNTYDDLANSFNLNKGSSDYIVTTYPFGENSLVVFKHSSILLLQNVQGSLADVTVTEITRQVGCIGINAVTTVGPDIAYMSDRNINLITMTATNNAVQHKTLPLSRNISGILKRVNWEYASLVSMAYFDNKLFVAVPLDNATTCNSVLVYNFVTENWFGEWTFASELSISIQGWAIADYLGLQRLHAITTDGRIFVTGEGQNDISGTTVAEISTSMVSRAYNFEGNNATQRRMWVDLGTNRPTISVTASTDGASETSEILTDQTYARTESWIFNDSTYDVTNANDDFNRAYRKDYASGPLAAGTTQGLPTTGLQCGTGLLPEQVQSYRVPLLTRRQGRLSWLEVTNTTGFIQIKGIGFENHAGQRSSLVQV